MTRILLVSLLCMAVPAAADPGPLGIVRPHGGDSTSAGPSRSAMTSGPSCSAEAENGVSCAVPMTWHGGSVLHGNGNGEIPVYLVWYGFSGTPPEQSIVEAFISSIGNSSYMNVVTVYSDSAGAASAKVTLGGSYHVTHASCPAAPASSLTVEFTGASGTDDLATIIGCSGAPIDPSGMYFVIPAAGINQTIRDGGGSASFCSDFCGWHSTTTVSGSRLVDAFVGEPGRGCNCLWGSAFAPFPNGETADSMISVIAHEIAEAITDPEGGGWYVTNCGAEISDLCAWRVCGNGLNKNPSGQSYSVNVGGHWYLLQDNWLNNAATGGQCVSSFGGNGSRATALAIAASATTISQPDTLTLTVTLSSNQAMPTISGDVTLRDGGNALGSMSVVPMTDASGHTGGTATFSFSRLSPGVHMFSASYGGDSSFDPSVSGSVPVTVVGVLSVVPSQPNVAPNEPKTLTTTGGHPPVTWSLTHNNSGASIDATGHYRAGSTPGVTDQVAAQDTAGAIAEAIIQVGPGVIVEGPAGVVHTGDTLQLTAHGGSGTGYGWSIERNNSGGFIDQSGLYHAGSTDNVFDLVSATDSLSNLGTLLIGVGDGVMIEPPPVLIPPRGTFTLTARGGHSYRWRMAQSNSGGTLRNNGIYTAGPMPYTQDTVEVTDDLNRVAQATLTVGPGVRITFEGIVHPEQTVRLTADGGSGTGYVWSLVTSQSSATLAADGTYTAGSQVGLDTVSVQDSLGNSITGIIQVADGEGLAIHGVQTVQPRGQLQLTATGGSGAGYQWTLTAAPSGGRITADGLYTAGTTGGVKDTVQVTDSVQGSVSADITVSSAPAGSGGDGGRRGCGCRSGEPDALVLPALLLMALWRVRRPTVTA